MPLCPKCGESPGSALYCANCDKLLEPAGRPDPFEIVGLAPAFELDAAALRKRLLELSRRMHPDYYGSAEPQVRALAGRNSAELNSAYEALADPAARAELLVRLRGGPSEQEERNMPRAFLMEVLEWNEALEEARAAATGSPQRDRLATLGAELRRRREEQLRAIAGLLNPLPERGSPALGEVRRSLNAIRYIDRALTEIQELALGVPAHD